MSAPSFAFVLCQRGAEPVLKRELARTALGWTAAYQRPGLVTFKTPGPLAPDFVLESVFARLYGLSLGMVTSLDEVVARARAFPEPVRVQVVERDLYRPDEAPPRAEVGALGARLDAELAALAPDLLRGPAGPGELVLDVIVAPDDGLFLGVHRHTQGRAPLPGGRYPVTVPPDAPSRAYAKIEEAMQAFGLLFQAGQRVLELGAAPGGAAYALARRGLAVLAVDPAEMDPRALAFEGPNGARIRHLAMPMGAVDVASLPRPIDWLLMDVHLAPQVALHGVRRLVAQLSGELRGVVLTLKLNDWAFAARIPEFLSQVEAMGVIAPRARQLPSHRQEIAIAGRFKARK